MAREWRLLLPEVRRADAATQRGVRTFQKAIADLVTVRERRAAKAERDRSLADAVAAWSVLLRDTERLARLGLGIAELNPEEAKYLVGGTVLELTNNLLDSARVLHQLDDERGSLRRDLFRQAQALAPALDLVERTFPDAACACARKLRALGSPRTPSHPRQGTAKPLATEALVASGRPDGKSGSRPSPSPRAAAGPGPIRILHMSDLHRTPQEKVSNVEVRRSLLKAISDLDGGTIDLIVVSGDVTQSAQESEYREAEAFLTQLTDRLLNGDRSRCIVVPGNHDVSWPRSRDGFRVEDSVDAANPPVGAVPFGKRFLVPSEATLREALGPFRESFQRFFARRYPAEAIARCEVLEPPGVALCILLLDTTVGMHVCNNAPSVSRDALSAAMEKALRNRKERPLLLAVGHHGPVMRRLQHDGLDPWVLDLLLEAGVRLYLHGHVHETQLHHHSHDGVNVLTCVGVGSLVADATQRPESAPRQYQIIELPAVGGQGTLRVRRKDRRDLQWRADKRFGSKANPTDRMSFSIQ